MPGGPLGGGIAQGSDDARESAGDGIDCLSSAPVDVARPGKKDKRGEQRRNLSIAHACHLNNLNACGHGRCTGRSCARAGGGTALPVASVLTVFISSFQNDLFIPPLLKIFHLNS